MKRQEGGVADFGSGSRVWLVFEVMEGKGEKRDTIQGHIELEYRLSFGMLKMYPLICKR